MKKSLKLVYSVIGIKEFKLENLFVLSNIEFKNDKVLLALPESDFLVNESITDNFNRTIKNLGIKNLLSSDYEEKTFNYLETPWKVDLNNNEEVILHFGLIFYTNGKDLNLAEGKTLKSGWQRYSLLDSVNWKNNDNDTIKEFMKFFQLKH